MKIYFACSITGGREFESVYQAIVSALTVDGHHILTAHLAQANAVTDEAHLTPREVYDRDVSWLRECDALVAEVSVPSHGVGYEIGFVLNEKKPAICLYQEGRKISKMISGNSDSNLVVRSYKSEQEAVTLARRSLCEIQS
ncbi:MAG TPA: nucleoside 2-deoxyribosyltransferase [Anaerolineales bacterium]|nr:nucleoside 2-deoxyribosyltransferase [Anaerolineales bacterium]